MHDYCLVTFTNIAQMSGQLIIELVWDVCGYVVDGVHVDVLIDVFVFVPLRNVILTKLSVVATKESKQEDVAQRTSVEPGITQLAYDGACKGIVFYCFHLSGHYCPVSDHFVYRLGLEAKVLPQGIGVLRRDLLFGIELGGAQCEVVEVHHPRLGQVKAALGNDVYA